MRSNMSNEDLIHALDLEVIRDRTHVASETTSTREGFREKLLERDRNCVWTGLGSSFCSGMHIISHRSAFYHLVLVNYLIVTPFLWHTTVVAANHTKSTKIR